MLSNYSYTPIIWPSVVTVLLLIVLAIFSGRRRSVPGALPFMVACVFSALWTAGSVLEIAAVNPSTKIFWFKFQLTCQLPSAIAITCFILEYAWPGRWLTRRNLILLSIPALFSLVVILTPGLAGWFWRGLVMTDMVTPLRTPLGWVLILYAYALALLNIGVFIWLFIRSPQHRWPVALMIAGLMSGRVLYLLETNGANLLLYLPPVTFEYLMYAIALFGFRMFDPISLARQAVIAQMRDGVLVVDLQGRVAYLNMAVEHILGSSVNRLKGRPVQELLPVYPDAPLGLDEQRVIELGLGDGQARRDYTLYISALKDWRGLKAGRLLLLHDVTEQMQAQARLLEQERALAMLHEREQLARELHDSTGQVLGFVRLQAQAARDLLAQGQTAAVDSDLAQLAAVAQEAQVDVREYILGAKISVDTRTNFLSTLQKFVSACNEHYKLRVSLVASPGWKDDCLELTTEMQLMRIVQEACTNARKHAQARQVEIKLQLTDSRVQVIIHDDGVGFDPQSLPTRPGQNYGLSFMRQRAEQAGGVFQVESTLGKGTSVIVEVPARK